jgi:uncharacterized protein YecT (DUF1311 family)
LNNVLNLAFAALFVAGSAMAEEPQWDCSDPGNLPQAGMNQCAYLDYKAADKELNAVYRDVRAYVKNVDADSAELGERYVGAEKALLKAQRAWIDYRDGHCEVEGFAARGGTLEPLLVATCLAQLTRHRTVELKSLIAGFE